MKRADWDPYCLADAPRIIARLTSWQRYAVDRTEVIMATHKSASRKASQRVATRSGKKQLRQNRENQNIHRRHSFSQLGNTIPLFGDANAGSSARPESTCPENSCRQTTDRLTCASASGRGPRLASCCCHRNRPIRTSRSPSCVLPRGEASDCRDNVTC
jgi:hypothetical protein